MSPLLVFAVGCAALCVAIALLPRLTSTVLFLALVATGCVEAGHARPTTAITAFLCSAAFGLLVLPTAPRNRRASP